MGLVGFCFYGPQAVRQMTEYPRVLPLPAVEEA